MKKILIHLILYTISIGIIIISDTVYADFDSKPVVLTKKNYIEIYIIPFQSKDSCNPFIKSTIVDIAENSALLNGWIIFLVTLRTMETLI